MSYWDHCNSLHPNRFLLIYNSWIPKCISRVDQQTDLLDYQIRQNEEKGQK